MTPTQILRYSVQSLTPCALRPLYPPSQTSPIFKRRPRHTSQQPSASRCLPPLSSFSSPTIGAWDRRLVAAAVFSQVEDRNRFSFAWGCAPFGCSNSRAVLGNEQHQIDLEDSNIWGRGPVKA